MPSFLHTRKTQIVTPDSKPVLLKGVNLGGWLMMEGYIMHSLNVAERKFKKEFAQALGVKALKEFERDFRDNFIQEKDIRTIAGFGFNCIRVPFNHRLVETVPYRYEKESCSYLDRIVRWAEKHKVWIILDLHAAAGSQNHDWHSDSLGKAELWTKKSYRQRTCALWEFLADRYKDKFWIAGYDLLNEAVLDNTQLLNQFYKELIKTIRKVDQNHILFVEGNRWATDLECLDELRDDNLVLSVHCYVPLDFTSNFVPHLTYPLKYYGISWKKAYLKKLIAEHTKVARKRSVPVFVGEFGANFRDGKYGEDKWLKDVLACFNESGFHWTYWTYKAIKNSILPDGIFSYYENPPWVNRMGPKLGWDNYARHWPTRRKEIIESWRTEEFRCNQKTLDVLRHALR